MKKLLLSLILAFLSISIYSQSKITLPGGIQTGMNEQDLRNYVKSNQKKFFTDNKQAYRYLHTIIDGIDYNIGLRTYKGKLNSVTYLSSCSFKSIDDPGLKLHYQKICGLLKESNNFGRIDLVYLKKTNSDWPYSMGTQLDIPMVNFFICSKWLCDFISIKIDEDEGKYGLIISFISVDNNTEETLWKDIYFD